MEVREAVGITCIFGFLISFIILNVYGGTAHPTYNQLAAFLAAIYELPAVSIAAGLFLLAGLIGGVKYR